MDAIETLAHEGWHVVQSDMGMIKIDNKNNSIFGLLMIKLNMMRKLLE